MLIYYEHSPIFLLRHILFNKSIRKAMMQMETGTLSVKTRKANGVYPVAAARVRVFDSADKTLLFDVVTDESGISPLMTVSTPPKSNSESPEGGDPYRRVEILVEKTGFLPVRDLMVPIASGVRSVQTVNLIPGSGKEQIVEEGGR